MRVCIHALFVVLLLSLSPSAVAHQLRPAIVQITFSDGKIDLQVETNIEAILAGIGPQHDNTDDAPQAQRYKYLRALPPQQLQGEFTSFEKQFVEGLQLRINEVAVPWERQGIEIPEVGDVRLARKSLFYYHAALPEGQLKAQWQYAERFGDVVVNLVDRKGNKQSFWLVAGEPSPLLSVQGDAPAREWSAVVADYLHLGFVHILPRGLDHILFVLGLFLLSRKLGPLLWQVTAFTIAHSITLALSIYGLISLSASIVEPLIALSIAYVGIENLLTRQLKPWRVAVVFVFGLLHGMGFAGVLSELGLPENEFVPALVAFNLGVEGGQIAVILGAFSAVFWLRSRDELYRNLIVVPGLLLITLMGLYWFWERTLS